MKSNKKIALVTGASSGLGRDISIKLSNIGYHLILAARSITGLEITSNNIKKSGGSSTIIPTDVTDPSSIKKLALQTLKIGFVDVIINNAGIGIFNKIEDTKIEDWDLQMSVNLRGAFLISQAFIPKMKQLKKGMLIFMNSTAGLKGYPYSVAYVSSKFGLRGFSKSLREELREYNIKVVSIHPGAIDTPFWDNIETNFSRDEMMKIDEIADTVIHAVQQNQIATVEEVVLRRTAGDFT